MRPACTGKMSSPVRVVQARNQNLAGPAARGVDELVVDDKQADMGKSPAIGIEKHQVAGP